MLRLAEGDRAALEEIYRATRVKLFGICFRILGDRKEAEDALQDVYVNLWQRADRYDPERASPISWLATFARNRAIDRLFMVGEANGRGHVYDSFNQFSLGVWRHSAIASFEFRTGEPIATFEWRYTLRPFVRYIGIRGPALYC